MRPGEVLTFKLFNDRPAKFYYVAVRGRQGVSYSNGDGGGGEDERICRYRNTGTRCPNAIKPVSMVGRIRIEGTRPVGSRAPRTDIFHTLRRELYPDLFEENTEKKY